MAAILIEDLTPLGVSLFGDRESYLNNLSVDDELGVTGGTSPATGTLIFSAVMVVTLIAFATAVRYYRNR